MVLTLVTGAHGFIGRHTCRTLAANGHTVIGLGHGAWPEAEARHFGVKHWINGEIVASNLRLIQQVCGTPDHVVHLAGGSSVGAAVANPREDFFRTVATTAELLDWMRADAPGCSLLAVSSAAVYGAGHEGPIAEEALPKPFSPYGHHKRLMEELCHSYGDGYGLRIGVARLFSVYGAGLTKQLLWDLCTRLERQPGILALSGTGDELRDWIDVRDVCRALVLLLPLASPEVTLHNVGSGIGTPVRVVAGALARHWVGPQGMAPELAFSGQSRKGDPFSLVAQSRGLQAMGFRWQIGLEQGLADYVSWFRARRPGA